LAEDLERVEPEAEARDWVVLDNGEESLDLVEASVVAAEIDATVILVAGVQDSGKTTLLVELYAQFLKGTCGGLRFAGSKTLDALDYRHFASRVDSGNPEAETERTQDSDMRLLHLRLCDQDGNHQALMPSDLKGELFEELINGREIVENVIPLARRADKTILLIDGGRVAKPASRQSAIRKARLLIGALTEPGGLHHDSPLLIALSKRDLLDEAAAAWSEAQSRGLAGHALERGLAHVRYLEVAARPKNGAKPTGLVDVLKWMWEKVDRPAVTSPTVPPQSNRVFVTGTLA